MVDFASKTASRGPSALADILVIIIDQLFYFCCFRAMTQQSILHLVVNWEVYTINMCCFIAEFYF